MRPSSSGAILALFPFFLGLLSLVTASPSNDTASDGRNPLHSKRCAKPQVRREWRALSDEERTEWITAVKVNSLLQFGTSPDRGSHLQLERSAWQKYRTRITSSHIHT